MQEDTLRCGLIGDEDVRCAIEDTGRGWVVTGGDAPDTRVPRLWPGTGPGTQALGFYQRRGWCLCARQQDAEDLVLEMLLP